MIYIPLLVNTFVKSPYGIIQGSISNDAVLDAVVLDIHTALVFFAKESVITSTDLWPINKFASGPRMSITTNSIAPLAKNI